MELIEKSYTGKILGHNNYFVYIPADERLRKVVAHYTIAYDEGCAAEEEKEQLHLIPDGSGTFLIELSDLAKVTVWGPSTKIRTITNDMRSKAPRIFVEFLAGGMHRVLGMDMHVIADKKIPLCMVKKDLCQKLRKQFSNATTYDEIVATLNDVLADEMKRYPIPPKIQKWIERLAKEKKFTSIKEIACDLDISERQLNRYANRYIGMGIKRYMKICNINHIIKDMRNKKLIDLTFEYDYFDQAHFNHVFKDVCQMSPKEYITNLSSFYNEMYKF